MRKNNERMILTATVFSAALNMNGCVYGLPPEKIGIYHIHGSQRRRRNRKRKRQKADEKRLLGKVTKKERRSERVSYKKQLWEKMVLRNLFLELTLCCNENCIHCGSKCEDGKEADCLL